MFKKCSCGVYTDSDEKECPFCGKKHADSDLISSDKLVSLIEKGEISPQKVWTKQPVLFYNVLKASP